MSPRLLVCVLLAGCAAVRPAPKSSPELLHPEEKAFLSDLRQLTFGGENAEAYWSFDGKQLSFQARHTNESCDRIYRMPVDTATPVQISSGNGATTCAHFFPWGELLYSSTQLAGPACPPRPDMSKGYVWALYDSYDIFRVAADGTQPRRLTTTPGYDAEATVCARDGSIVFTSTRDGDIDLYRMDADGKNVQQLTHEPGYDGGAFFNHDCTKIVWRASRPKPGKELDDYRKLLAQGLVRPSKLEIWTADADGSNPVQLTYLDAASFAPSFHPTENVIIFSSNSGDPRGREFDLWAIRADGSDLTRITRAPGFDGFPHFSPDGQWLAFSSNRATPPGQHDTNVFVARWRGLPVRHDSAADRVRDDVAWLADPARQGRGLGSNGLTEAGIYLEDRLRALKLEPAGDDGTFRNHFPVVTSAKMGPETKLAIAGKPVAPEDLTVLGFSASGAAEGPLVLANYGIVDDATKIDDYAHLDVKGKIVLVRRFAPETPQTTDAALRARLGDVRRKAWAAREHGAKGLIVVDWPLPPAPRPDSWKEPQEAPFPRAVPDGGADSGLPVMMVKRAALAPHLDALAAGRPVKVALETALVLEKTQAFNVVGRIRAGHTSGSALIIGAHYDHLGLGGPGSLAPDRHEPHLGADDNASGTAAVLELARALSARRADLSRDVVVVLFSGEEAGLLGSMQFTRTRADVMKTAVAMLNLDMVGRLRRNRIEILGSDTAGEWGDILKTACESTGVICAASGDGFGASDQVAFYGAGLPVLHFFTGTHADYHKPSDTAAKINAAGAAAVARLVEKVAVALEDTRKLTYHPGAPASARGDARTFNASFGSLPDYSGPPNGAPGVLLAGVHPGGAADKGGVKAGDVLVRLGPHEIRNVQDLAYALNSLHPGETIVAEVLRNGAKLALSVTMQQGHGR